MHQYERSSSRNADHEIAHFPTQLPFLSHADSPTSNTVFENVSDVSELGLSDTVFAGTNSFMVSSSPNNIDEQQNASKPNVGITSTPRKSISETKHKRISSSNVTGIAVCRICHSGEASCPFSNGEPLISPCHCRGYTGLYHRTCLERWLSTANKDKCEICKFQYHIERQPKGLSEFLANPGSKTMKRHVISDFVCWLILTPTAFVGAGLCVSEAVSRARTNSESIGLVQVPTLIGLAVFLIVTYLIWSVICFRYHIKTWRRWRLRNYTVRVLDAEAAKKRRHRRYKSVDSSANDGFQMRRPPSSSHYYTRRQSLTGPRPVQPTVSLVTGSSGTRYSSPWIMSPVPRPRIHRAASYSSRFGAATRSARLFTALRKTTV